MYVHQQDWKSALRIAENYDGASRTEVLLCRAYAAYFIYPCYMHTHFFVSSVVVLSQHDLSMATNDVCVCVCVCVYKCVCSVPAR